MEEWMSKVLHIPYAGTYIHTNIHTYIQTYADTQNKHACAYLYEGGAVALFQEAWGEGLEV
jgi:chloramphenicol 3-O-phosphotransferase